MLLTELRSYHPSLVVGNNSCNNGWNSVDFVVGDFIARHAQMALPTICRCYASLRRTLMNRLHKRAERGVHSSSMASLNNKQPRVQGTRHKNKPPRVLLWVQGTCHKHKPPAKGSTRGARDTLESQAAKGTRNTPKLPRSKNIIGGHANTLEKQHAKPAHPRSPGIVGAAIKELFQ